MFQLTRHVTGVLWANLGLLFCLSLFPFTTKWMDAHFARTAVIVYGVNLLMAAVAYYILQSVIIRVQGKDSPLRKAIGRDLKGKLSPAFYIAGMLAALIGGAGAGRWIAVACYVAVAAMWVIPDRRIEMAIAAELAPAEPAEPDTQPDGEPGRESGGSLRPGRLGEGLAFRVVGVDPAARRERVNVGERRVPCPLLCPVRQVVDVRASVADLLQPGGAR
jgi:hypothetical protein